MRFKKAGQILPAIKELGLRQVWFYALYHLGLRTSIFRLLTPPHALTPPHQPYNPISPLLDQPPTPRLQNTLGMQVYTLLTEAEELLRGNIRLFGGPPVPLEIIPTPPLFHWTKYERGTVPWGTHADVKYIWEPARFGWVYTLGRAYLLTGREDFPRCFWHNLEAFVNASPPNLGPHWASGQEIALRILAWSWAAQVFATSPESTPPRICLLQEAIAVSARRILPTHMYSRAQFNNHSLSEAAGMYTAGTALPAHPASARWRKFGWHRFWSDLLDQIEPDGTYSQHSVNYHRVMLELALWMRTLGLQHAEQVPLPAQQKLAAATGWLLQRFDLESGQAANLGSNDGAHILPLAEGGFADYRPVLQACARAFWGKSIFPPGAWDELSLWLGLENPAPPPPAFSLTQRLRIGAAPLPGQSHTTDTAWALLRAERFTCRPSHADQLHVELWWRGINLAQDAGTFEYNGSPPWNNPLPATRYHNTITINDADQMTRAGRFLYLGWAQAVITEKCVDSSGNLASVTAHHNGYAKFGVRHQRTLAYLNQYLWQITDLILPIPPAHHPPLSIRLHWLLPDFPWQLDSSHLILSTPFGAVRIEWSAEGVIQTAQTRLVRAGALLNTTGQAHPTEGWTSPTYAYKIPALSLSVNFSAKPPLQLITRFQLPG